MKKCIIGVLSFFFFLPTVFALEDLAPNSKSAFLVEVSTGKVLYEKMLQKNYHQHL